MERDSLIDRFDKVTREIENMKTNQSMGADSWIVYRQGDYFDIETDVPYLVDFVPYIEGPFVARLYQKNSQVYEGSSEPISWSSVGFPDPNINGRWWIPADALSGGINNPYFFEVYSTRQGTISVRPI